MAYDTEVQQLGEREYLTGSYNPDPQFLPEDIYQTVLKNAIIFCCDGILLNQGQMMIAKRSVHPHPDWWHIGGRMRPGETFRQAVIRNLRREIGIEFEPERFVQLGLYNLMWPTNRGDVDDVGVHDVSLTFVIEVTDDERSAVRLNQEYEGNPAWVHPEEVINRAADFHPAVVQFAVDVRRYLANNYR